MHYKRFHIKVALPEVADRLRNIWPDTTMRSAAPNSISAT
jgi:hypothetical protein